MATSGQITITKSVEDAEEIGVDKKSVCPLCLKASVKYTCPRCNTPYCSVDCYKSDKHRDCSEMFYKDCFMEGLKECNADQKDKHKVMEMLARVENNPDLIDPDGDIGEPTDDLHERLDDLDLDKDSDKIWARLTDKEKKEFEAMAGDGRLGNLMELWTPWWAESSPMVTDMDSQSEAINAKPKIKADIPSISDICKTKPSADVKYNMINILYAYVFVCRLHNGEHVTLAAESALDLINLSVVLGQGHSCGSTGEAIQACLKILQSGDCKFESTPQFNVSILKDVQRLICGSNKDNPLKFVLTAVSDVNCILKKAHKVVSKTLKSAKTEVKKEKLSKGKLELFKSLKKCDFMLSWVQTYGMALVGLVPELEIEYALLYGELEAVNQSKMQLESEWGGKVRPQRKKLIQEI